MKIDFSENCRHIGKLLQEWRLLNGLSLYIIAKANGQRIQSLQRTEEGKGSIQTLIAYLWTVKAMDNNRDTATLFKAIQDAI